MKNRGRLSGLLVFIIGIIFILDSFQGVAGTGAVISESVGLMPVKIIGIILIFVGFLFFIVGAHPRRLRGKLEKDVVAYRRQMMAGEHRKKGEITIKEAEERYIKALTNYAKDTGHRGGRKEIERNLAKYIDPKSLYQRYDSEKN